jgi:D-alanyl-D-alanine carboxypeptidase (penicillin-binding protein 5/6)
MRLISVVMGEPTEPARVNDSIALMTYGYRFYKTYQLYGANQAVTQARVWQGQDANVAIGLAKPLYVTVPIGQYNKLAADANLKQPIYAPIAKGQALGQISVTLDGKPLLAQPLVALTADPQGSIWRRFADRVSLSVHNMLKKKDVAATEAKTSA